MATKRKILVLCLRRQTHTKTWTSSKYGISVIFRVDWYNFHPQEL